MSRRALMIVVALVALQVAAIVVWRAVDEARAPNEPLAGERVSGSAPSIQFEYLDRTTSSLEDLRGCPILLHFWASWCGPCRDELPAVLALDIDGLGVIAAAIDDTWPAMSQLADTRSRRVVRVVERSKALGIGELPVTLLIDSEGKLIERYQGPREWRSAAARAHLERILGAELACPDGGASVQSYRAGSRPRPR